MSLKINNLRLELDDPEEVLPAHAAGRLGLDREALMHWRILRKSLDARRHDDLHYRYAIEVEVPDLEAHQIRSRQDPEIQPFVPERFWWPDPGLRPLDHPPVIIGAGPAGLIAGYFLAAQGYRPLILERGRAVKERVADVRRFDEGARSTRKATTSSAREGPEPSATASSPRAIPGQTCCESWRSWRNATASRPSSTSIAPTLARTACRWSFAPCAGS